MGGEPVTVSVRTATGTDPMGQPTYAWAAHTVMALVGESTSSQRSETRPEGIESRISLALPRTCGLDLRGARITWKGRTYAVEGEPHHVASPLEDWDMNVEAVMVDG